MTLQERKLWYEYLRNYPVRVLRQKVIADYIVDFYCRKANLAIEIDGGQHFTKENKKADVLRTNMIEEFGIKVIRFLNSDINDNFAGVCSAINIEIKSRIDG